MLRPIDSWNAQAYLSSGLIIMLKSTAMIWLVHQSWTRGDTITYLPCDWVEVEKLYKFFKEVHELTYKVQLSVGVTFRVNIDKSEKFFFSFQVDLHVFKALVLKSVLVFGLIFRTTKVDLRTKVTLASSKQKDSGAGCSSSEQETKKV